MDVSSPEEMLAAAGAITEQPTRSSRDTEGADRLVITRVSDLAGVAPPEREWVVPGWLPVGAVTLNYGDGGTGKSLLVQQLMASCATGGQWLGLDVLRCKSFALFCEDDDNELHRRQLAMCAAQHYGMSDLANMEWTSRVGEDNLLVTFDAAGRAHGTKLLSNLLEAIREHEARLIVIDTAADTFGGNENDRSQVRQYVGRILGGIAQELNAAVLMNAHPSRAGISSGEQDGGSTGWSNSARSRWGLTRPLGKNIPKDTPERILTRRKGNYAAIGDEVRVRWEAGVFVREFSTGDGRGGAIRDAAVEVRFLELLERFISTGRPVSHSRNASNFAPKIFASQPDRRDVTEREFAAAQERLLADGRVVLERYGRSGDTRQRLARGSGVAA